MCNGVDMAKGETYEEFVEKFKPKKTTDDCYTPDNIYKVVKDWACKEYGLDPDKVIRPFWPGADYTKIEYHDGYTVIDNPPFSILAKIEDYYIEHGIKYFLFAPYLTILSGSYKERCAVVTDVQVAYKNGAKVSTCFVTNMDHHCAITAPDLNKAINKVNKANIKKDEKRLPKYDYPDNVLTSAMLGYIAKNGIDLKIKREDVHYTRALDSQKVIGKEIFGAGCLLSDKVAAQKAAALKAAYKKNRAIVWELSDREREIIKQLG
jgi:hypothetical protein